MRRDQLCDELKCKCKRYCRCRGVPVPLFSGENDGLGVAPEALFYATYTYNTDPPRAGAGLAD